MKGKDKMIKEILDKKESLVAGRRIYKKVEYICIRKRCGTYPKWLAKFSNKVMKFFFKKKFQMFIRGRGKRVEASKKYGFTLNYDRDLPIKYAKRVAVYITLEK